MSRDIVKEITSIKERSLFGPRADVFQRIYDLDKFLNNNYASDYNRIDNEIIKYIPISIVACFESFFKDIIKELIDFGEPYSNKIIAYNKTKLDFDIFNAIQNKKFTIGEFISHSLSYNNLNEIRKNIEILIESDFIEKSKDYNRKSSVPEINELIKMYNTSHENIITDIKQLYFLRHIFCHESGHIVISKEEIIRSYRNAKIFLQFINDYFTYMIYPNYPENQMELNIQSYEDATKAQKELDKLILKIIEKIKKPNNDFYIEEDTFNQSMTQWVRYRESMIDCLAGTYRGGTMYNYVMNTRSAKITEEKIESLKKEFEVFL